MVGSLFGVPKCTISIRLTKDVSLSITVVVDPNTDGTTESNQCRGTKRQIGGTIGRQVECGTRVDRGDPYQTSPANIISRTIMLNVHTISSYGRSRMKTKVRQRKNSNIYCTNEYSVVVPSSINQYALRTCTCNPSPNERIW